MGSRLSSQSLFFNSHQTFEDLKGKGYRFALADANSTSGRLMPLYGLKQAGFDLVKDIQTYYAGSHAQVIEQVKSGVAPAGGVSSEVYEEYLRNGQFREGDDIIVLWKSTEIPTGPIVVRKDIQHTDELRIEDAFLTVEDIDQAALSTTNVGGFDKITHKSYEFLLKHASEVGIDIASFD
jgi:phosphonate transport system substrate-binding protein